MTKSIYPCETRVLYKYLKNEDEDEDDLKNRRTKSERRKRTIWKTQIQRHSEKQRADLKELKHLRLEFYHETRVLKTRGAIFSHCFANITN